MFNILRRFIGIGEKFRIITQSTLPVRPTIYYKFTVRLVINNICRQEDKKTRTKKRLLNIASSRQQNFWRKQIMPIGKEVGSYSLKSTSISKSVDAAGNHVFVQNMEGTVSGG